jgi:trans-aconitate 2-methyltransferase
MTTAMATDTWSPTQYEKFRREREQPFHDLLAMVRPAPDMRVVDLGCGTGRQTRMVHVQLHARETIGLDRSPQMLDAQRGEPALDGLTFETDVIEKFPGDRGRFDLIFSNAALHWVPDHPVLIARFAEALNPGGQLAFQIPASYDDESHLVAEELIATEPYRSACGGWHRPNYVLQPAAYSRLLHRAGFAAPDVRLIVYPHLLAGPEDVIEWFKGTLLTEYARHLPADMFDGFVRDYRERLLARLEPSRPFFFPFKRILCRAERPA